MPDFAVLDSALGCRVTQCERKNIPAVWRIDTFFCRGGKLKKTSFAKLCVFAQIERLHLQRHHLNTAQQTQTWCLHRRAGAWQFPVSSLALIGVELYYQHFLFLKKHILAITMTTLQTQQGRVEKKREAWFNPINCTFLCLPVEWKKH